MTTIIVSKQRLQNLQQSIIILSDEIKEGCIANISRLFDKVNNLLKAYMQLRPVKNIEVNDQYFLDVEKLLVLQKNINKLADCFNEGLITNLDNICRRIQDVNSAWISLGKNHFVRCNC